MKRQYVKRSGLWIPDAGIHRMNPAFVGSTHNRPAGGGGGGGGGSPIITGSIVYYKADENGGTTANDASGNGHTGTWSGTAAWGAAYIGVSSFQFNGSSWVASASSSAFDGTSNQTLALWFKLAAAPASFKVIGGPANSGATKYHIIEVTSNGHIGNHIQGSSGSEGGKDATGKNYADNNWHHVVSVLDSTTKTADLWVDNVLIGTSTAASGTLDFGGVFSIGAYGTGGSFGITGFVDEPGLWPFKLTSTQIGTLFNQTHP